MNQEQLLALLKTMGNKDIENAIIDYMDEQNAAHKKQLDEVLKENVLLTERAEEAIEISEEFEKLNDFNQKEILALNVQLTENQSKFGDLSKALAKENLELETQNLELVNKLDIVNNELSQTLTSTNHKQKETTLKLFNLQEEKAQHLKLTEELKTQVVGLKQDLEKHDNEMQGKTALIDGLAGQVDELARSNEESQKEIEKLKQNQEGLSRELDAKDRLIEELLAKLQARDEVTRASTCERSDNDLSNPPSDNEVGGMSLEKILSEELLDLSFARDRDTELLNKKTALLENLCNKSSQNVTKILGYGGTNITLNGKQYTVTDEVAGVIKDEAIQKSLKDPKASHEEFTSALSTQLKSYADNQYRLKAWTVRSKEDASLYRSLGLESQSTALDTYLKS